MNTLPPASSSCTSLPTDIARQFIRFALSQNALRFGDFTLKSGRKSPYFFNLGEFSTGLSLKKLGQFYARIIQHAGLEVDMLLGPAYKGIPLVSSIAIALSECTQRDIPFCFDRKEKKEHGEKGKWIGTPLQGKVLIVDDVISAGTTARALLPVLQNMEKVQPIGMLVALDRKEQHPTTDRYHSSAVTASEYLQKRYAIPFLSLACFQDLIHHLAASHSEAASLALHAMQTYYQTYGVH